MFRKLLKRYQKTDTSDSDVMLRCDGCGGVILPPPETIAIMYDQANELIYSPGPCQAKAVAKIAWESDEDIGVIICREISYRKAVKLYKQGKLKQAKGPEPVSPLIH